MSGKYEIFTDSAGEFRFRLVASNGKVIATSEGYKRRASAVKAIESIKKNVDSPVAE